MKFRIKEARISANLTQEQLAKKLGISNTTLSGYEVGAHDPKSNLLVSIAQICNTSVDYLLGLDPENVQNDQPDDCQVMVSAGPDEQELISIYRELTAHAQGILIGTARGLFANPDMKKAGASNTATA